MVHAEMADYQRTVLNLPLTWVSAARAALTGKKRRVQILNTLDGVLEAGEMLVVLGPPGRQATETSCLTCFHLSAF